jgi:hypothetical protein
MEVVMRYFGYALSALAVSLFFSLPLAADSGKVDFSGVWELDSAKSQDGRAITLKIENVSNKVKVVRAVRDKDGKEVTSEFVCETGAGECEYDEAGHKAKVTLWYNGPALVILKTEGLKEDASDEWTLKLSNGTKTLTVDLEHIDPTGNPETLVFNRKAGQVVAADSAAH